MITFVEVFNFDRLYRTHAALYFDQPLDCLSATPLHGLKMLFLFVNLELKVRYYYICLKNVSFSGYPSLPEPCRQL